MEGGELFDRIQRKGHFTERGQDTTQETPVYYSGTRTLEKIYICVFNPSEAANIIRSISLALAHLHHMNIAHRDLKVGVWGAKYDVGG